MNTQILGYTALLTAGVLATMALAKKEKRGPPYWAAVNIALILGLILLKPMWIPQWLWLPTVGALVAQGAALHGINWLAYAAAISGWIFGLINMAGTSIPALLAQGVSMLNQIIVSIQGGF